MTVTVFYEDSYLKELDAEVVGVDGDRVELDRTIFYPTGGGQPGDTGVFVLAGGELVNVLDTRKGETAGVIIHQLEANDHGIRPGDRLQIRLDWDRRYRHMQMHTGMHLLGALVPVPVTGGSVGAEKSRLDFNLGEARLDKDELTEGINRLIAADHPVRFESITDEELDERPELVRTMSVQPPRGAGTVRMVRVVDVDFQPCGGTHVGRTGEISALRVAKIENKGRQNRRVNIVWDD